MMFKKVRQIGGMHTTIWTRTLQRTARQMEAASIFSNTGRLLVGALAAKKGHRSSARIIREMANRNGGKIMGTARRTRKGPRVFLDAAAIKRSGHSFRNVFHHESFHTIPILGRSEILAHAFGGLKQTKGKLSFGKALKEVKHLKKGRPARFKSELAIGAAVAGGGSLAAKKVHDVSKPRFVRIRGRIVPIRNKKRKRKR